MSEGWKDKIYSVCDRSLLVYCLAFPVLLLVHVVARPKRSVDFGYEFLSPEKYQQVRGCGFFDKDDGFCSWKNNVCSVLIYEECKK